MEIKAEAVIFDMDGVLVNTEQHHKEIEHRMFSELGIAISEEEREPYIGMAADELWAVIVDAYGLKKNSADLLDLNNQRIIEYFSEKQDLNAIPGVRKVLEWIQERQISTAVASSSSSVVIDALLAESGLDSYFDVRVGGQAVEKSKPEPFIYLHTAELLQVNADSCVVIEDSTNGIAAAKSAGMYCIGYQGTGFHGQDQSKADQIIGHFDELIPFLETAFNS